MAVCPFAEWRGPVPGRTPGGMGSVQGVVFHIMGASYAAADGWFHNPASKVSAHFGIKQTGSLVQWVDTADRAWHAGAANAHWIGVETEGSSGPLSEAGCATFGRLYRWIHDTYGVAYSITDTPAGSGFGWHGMGGAAWGGHPYCPGPARIAQRQHVIDLASGGAPPQPHPQEEDEMALMLSADGKPGVLLRTGGLITGVRDPQSFYAYAAAGVPSVKVSGPEWDAANKLAQ